MWFLFCTGSLHEEQRCGRPLGMRIDSSGLLLVADAYLGLFRVNVDNGEDMFGSVKYVDNGVDMFGSVKYVACRDSVWAGN